MTAASVSPAPILGTLARQEIRKYLRSKLFLVGAAVWLLGLWGSLFGSHDGTSTSGGGIVSAAVVGLVGLVVMAGLVRNSDRAAAAAGTVAVPQRIRTLALAAAVVVPATMGLIAFAAAVVGYQTNPPDAWAAPAGSIGEDIVYAQLFSEGVMACIGGPLLGLVIGRWLPRRGVAPVVVVGLVVITMVLQPLFEWAERIRLGWVWIHFFVQTGIEGDPERMVRHTGSPYFYIGYQATLCVLGVLVAVYADPEADRTRLRRTILAVAGVAVVLVALALLVGPQDRIIHPVPSPGAGT